MSPAEIGCVIDSDNAESRCGCPARMKGPGGAEIWSALVARVDDALIAECQICSATWQWGRYCAVDPT